MNSPDDILANNTCQNPYHMLYQPSTNIIPPVPSSLGSPALWLMLVTQVDTACDTDFAKCIILHLVLWLKSIMCMQIYTEYSMI